MSVPKLRFKEFDGKWSAQKYKDALTIKYGKDHKLLEDGEIPVYGTGGVMRYVNQYLYDGESILIGRKGTIDQPKYVNEKFWTVDTLFYSEIKQNIYPLFIYQHALQVNWLGLNEATGVPSLNTTSINNVDIYLPSKPEQTKIASFLSAVDEKISQFTQKHELLSQYKQGMMQKLFSQQIRFKADDGSEFGEWEEKKLSEISIKIKDGTHFSPKTFEVGEYKYLTSKNVKDGYLDFSNLEYVTKEEHLKIYSSCDVKYGDVLLTKDGTIGQCCVNTLHEEFSLLSSVAFLRLKPEYNNYFLYHLLVSDLGQKEISSAIAGQALKRITLTKINNFSFCFPCLAEQTKIANFLSSIDQKIEGVAQQIEQAKQWKKGLLQQMFV